ncbi:grasp-with-spasm system ATP-grasp peptide maturase [Chryseobacterium koreense]
MILIISNNNERTTTEIISWLVAYKKEFIRVHENEVFNIKVKNKRIFLESMSNEFFIDEITSVWYRRGGLKFKRYKYQDKGVNQYMDETQHWLEDYIRNYFENKPHINKESRFNINKLIVLDTAKTIGFKVPEYFLSDNTDEVQLHKTIVKTINGNGVVEYESSKLKGLTYTSIITKKEKKEFFISFFQEKIEKEFEIRSFYLHGKIWSMAIFSQNDKQTQLDFRNYNYQKPNRFVPYKLPINIEKN